MGTIFYQSVIIIIIIIVVVVVARYGIVPPEVFCEAKMRQFHIFPQ